MSMNQYLNELYSIMNSEYSTKEEKQKAAKAFHCVLVNRIIKEEGVC